MSDGKKFIAALLESGSVQALRDIDEGLFDEDEIGSFRFVRSHYRRYRELPSIATVEQESGQRLPDSPEPPDYYLRRLKDRRLFTLLRTEFSGLRDRLQRFDMESAKDSVARMNTLCRESGPGTDIRNVRDAAESVLRQYAQAHDSPGMTGVPTGWPTLDESSGGYQRGDLISWVARLGVGKTYTLLNQAAYAWRNGYNVLVVTLEMTIEQIVRRIIGMESGVNPEYIRKGTLDEFGMRRLTQYVNQLAGADRLHIYSGSFSKKISDIEMMMVELSPDIVFIDGAYLLIPESMNRLDRNNKVAAVYDELKKLALSSDRPIVTTSQFSRQAGSRGKAGSLENISFTDAIATHSSIVLSIKEGSPPNEISRREIEVLKGREGESAKFEINYRFSPVDFSEVPPEQVQAESTSLDWMP